MVDTIKYDPDTKRVELIKASGRSYLICSYDNAHQSHQRGAFTYPADSLEYLRKHGYIAH